MHDLQHDRAFVLRFTDDTDVAADRVQGRVEHVASGRSVRFESVAELLAFIARVIVDRRSAP